MYRLRHERSGAAQGQDRPQPGGVQQGQEGGAHPAYRVKTCKRPAFLRQVFFCGARAKFTCFSCSDGRGISLIPLRFLPPTPGVAAVWRGAGAAGRDLRQFYLSFREKMHCFHRDKRRLVHGFSYFEENPVIQLHHAQKGGKLALHRNFDRNVTIPIKSGNLSVEKG